MKKNLSAAPLTKNSHLLNWVNTMAELCQPDHVHWVDGSQSENDELCEKMVAAGTFIRLNEKKWPGCFLARSDAHDVARVEDRTFICAFPRRPPARPTTGSIPFEMKRKLRGLFKGA